MLCIPLWGGDGFGGVGRAAAKIVFAVRTHPEIRGIAIDPDFHPGFERVIAPGIGKVLAALEEVTVGLHDRSGCRIEGLKDAVDELDSRIGVVEGWKAGSRARDAKGRFQGEARRTAARPRAHNVALAVDVFNAEGGIDGRLVRVGCRPGEVVKIEAGKELVLPDRVIDANRELIRVGGDFGGRRVGRSPYAPPA